jgi:hypothetical protein
MPTKHRKGGSKMTIIDKEWQDGDDAELEDKAYSAGFSEGIEYVQNRLAFALTNVKEALADLDKKYEGGGFYSNEDSSFQDYFEGQICAYEHAIAIVEGKE